MKKMRNVAFALLLLVGGATNFAGLLSSAEASDLPCFDMWSGCTGSYEYCDGLWCGCMGALYGYQCSAALSNAVTAIDHRAVEMSLIQERGGTGRSPQQKDYE